ncbi:MAG TPA: hypothetical protein VL020_03225 [Pseudomonadales bacterium]|nr:hypothetical protein [Pseudomonadales bacterium]
MNYNLDLKTSTKIMVHEPEITDLRTFDSGDNKTVIGSVEFQIDRMSSLVMMLYTPEQARIIAGHFAAFGDLLEQEQAK